MRSFLRFRLSTAFLVILIIGILLAWYVDRDRRRDIIGVWYYPPSELAVLGYTSMLEIRDDGMFTKTQHYRMGSETFEGTYTIKENGRVLFHVKSKTVGTVLDDFMRDDFMRAEPEIIEVDRNYSCRCAVDPAGYLVIDADGFRLDNAEVGIRWETCAPNTSYFIP